jgi:RNA polymerase sigma-70 factor (ECF subfamily)
MHQPRTLQQSLSSLSDEQIVERVQHGELGLFELLMRRYNQRVYRVARSIVRDEEEAEDVMQDAYVRAFEHIRQFEGRARFSTWLTKIAVHEALHRLRRRSRLVLVDLTSEENQSVEILHSPKRDPEDQASGQELSSVLSGVIEGLPDLYRVVFVLREIEGLSTAEVAESLAISEENVKVRLHRARALLRRDIDKHIGTEARLLYAFHLKRCDRIVIMVLQRIVQTPDPGRPPAGSPLSDSTAGRSLQPREGRLLS